MPHISSRRLHTRDHMSRVLSAAGQFAHLNAREIDGALADLYRSNARFDGDGDLAASRAAVSDDLVRLHRGRLIQMVYDAAGTIGFVTERYGSVCPLCHALEFSSYTLRGGYKLSFLVSPKFLAVAPTDKELTNGALCRDCWEGLFRVYGPGPWWHDDTNMMVSALAALVAKQTFRARVSSNKFRRLRFDPRRVR